MLLKKSTPLTDVCLKFQGDVGKFSGYASKFGGVDSYGDTILPGAFKHTLETEGLPKMFWDHRWDMPIGKYTKAFEDETGLFVEGEFTPGLPMADGVRAAMKHGTLDGLSIGGFGKKGDYEETERGRAIHKWSWLVEVSPVTFPADSSARVDLTSVKSTEVLLPMITAIESPREFESFLRDVGGLSKGAALALMARAKALFGEPGEPRSEADAKHMAALIDRLNRIKVPT